MLFFRLTFFNPTFRCGRSVSLETMVVIGEKMPPQTRTVNDTPSPLDLTFTVLHLTSFQTKLPRMIGPQEVNISVNIAQHNSYDTLTTTLR